MKKFIIPVVASVSIMLASCSTSQQLARQTTDDMYGTDARAQVVNIPNREDRQRRAADYDQGYDSNGYNTSGYEDDNLDYDFDYGYASRINRFSYGSPYRSYYDNFYTLAYDPWMYPGWTPGWGAGMSIGLNFGLGGGWGGWGWNSAFYSPWAYHGYGYPLWMNFWGPVSYYGYGWPGYGFGWGGGFGWGSGLWGYARENRVRPNMGNGNPNYGRRGYMPNYGRSNTISGRDQQPGRGYDRPVNSRPSIDRGERPARVERPERDNFPTYRPNTSSGRGFGGGFGGGGGVGGGGNSRPSRGSR